MNSNNLQLRGMSRLIMQALQEIAPTTAQNSQIIDCRLLQQLEEHLQQKLVKREDGSSRLVIDLVLRRSMHEIRQLLSNTCTVPAANEPPAKAMNSLASL